MTGRGGATQPEDAGRTAAGGVSANGGSGVVGEVGSAGSDAPVELRDALTDLADWHLIGRGGFASVFAARQRRLGRNVAVKLLTSSASAATLASFLAECELLGPLGNHDAIVTLYDAGATASGRPYLVMARLTGGTLAQRVEDGGLVTANEVTLVATRIASALHAAHERGVLHLDVKPANVLLTADGLPVLGDFGVARLDGAAAGPKLPFSPFYAAPEVLQRGMPTRATDVYGLGATLFTLMRATPPYWRPDDNDVDRVIARTIAGDRPDPPLRFGPELADLVTAMLDRAPGRRPSLAEVTRGLDQLSDRATSRRSSHRTVDDEADRSTPTRSTPAGTTPGSTVDELIASLPRAVVEPSAPASSARATPDRRPGAVVPRRSPGRPFRAIALVVLVLAGLVTGAATWAASRTQHRSIRDSPPTGPAASATTTGPATTASSIDGGPTSATAATAGFPPVVGARWSTDPKATAVADELLSRSAGVVRQASARMLERDGSARVTVVHLVLDPSAGVVDEATFATVVASRFGSPNGPPVAVGATFVHAIAPNGNLAVAVFLGRNGEAWLVVGPSVAVTADEASALAVAATGSS